MDDTTIRRRDRLKKHYTTVSNVIIFGYPDLTDSEKLTYQAIDSFDWSDGEGKRKGFSYPSVATLARLRGISERTIQRHLEALEGAGLLTREVRTGRPSLLWIEEPSKEESERYLSTIAIGGDTDVTPTGDTDVTPTGDMDVTPNKKDESEKDKTVNAEQSSWKGRRQRLSADELAKREWLAGEMVRQLKDEHSLGFYRKVADTFRPEQVFEVLSEVRTRAREQHIASRGALFASLAKGVKQY